MAFSHNGDTFDGELVSAMGALIEWAGRKMVSGMFTSWAEDFFFPKKIFEKPDNFFVAVGENAFCHCDLL